MKEFVGQTRSVSSDLAFSVDVGPLVDGDHVVVRWIATGHYGGGMPGAGAPVGTEVTISGTDILSVADNQIVEYWLNADTPRPDDAAPGRRRLADKRIARHRSAPVKPPRPR